MLFAVVGGLTILIAAGYAAAFLWAAVWTGLSGDPWVGLFLRGVCLPIAVASVTWIGLWRWMAEARPGSIDHP